MRRALLLAVAGLSACAGTSSSSAPSAAKPGSTIVRGRFIGYALTPDFTVSVLGCKAARGDERVRKDGTFELRVDGCPPGIHHLTFGRNASGMMKFAIRGPVTDVGTIEGDK